MGDLASAIENVGCYAITVWAVFNCKYEHPRLWLFWPIFLVFIMCISTVNK